MVTEVRSIFCLIHVGHVQSACWSPDGLTLFFASSMEPTIFALNSGSSGSAVPVADVSSIFYDTGEDKIQ